MSNGFDDRTSMERIDRDEELQQQPAVVSPVTNVIVKASSSSKNNSSNANSMEGVLVIVPKNLPYQQHSTAQHPVIVKNPISPFVSVTPGVIRSTKSEEYKTIYVAQPTPSTSSTTSNEESETTTIVDRSSVSPSDESDRRSQASPFSRIDTPDSVLQERGSSSSSCVSRSGANSRDARNKAEKERRDRFNNSIKDLADMLPILVGSNKKVDKTSVLRLTAHELRKEHVFGDSVKNQQFDFPLNTVDAVVDLMGGFLITITCKGLFVLVTPNIEQYLGYSPIDLVGNNIVNYIHSDDINTIIQQIMPLNVPVAPNGRLLIPKSVFENDDLIQIQKRHFLVRFLKFTQQRSQAPEYLLCDVEGTFRVADKAALGDSHKLVRRQRIKENKNAYPSGNDIVFIALVRPIKPKFYSEMLLPQNQMEYKTRHLIDGRIIDCDSRISLVTGYLKNEVVEASGFSFMHKDDVRWIMVGLRRVYDNYAQYGESCYRLINRTGEFVYLYTRGFIEFSEDPKTATILNCVNTLIDNAVGEVLVEEMKKKYAILIDRKGDLPTLLPSSGSSVEEPKQLELAISHLVTNLSSIEINKATNSNYRRFQNIVPPEFSTTKASIMKSVGTLNAIIGNNKNFTKFEYNIEDVTVEKKSKSPGVLKVKGKKLENAQQQKQLKIEHVEKKYDAFLLQTEQIKSEENVDDTKMMLCDNDKQNLDSNIDDNIILPSDQALMDSFVNFNMLNSALDVSNNKEEDMFLNMVEIITNEEYHQFKNAPSTSDLACVNPTDVLKRKTQDRENYSQSMKRKMSVSEDTLKTFYPLEDMDPLTFEKFIQELTETNTELAEIIPSTLLTIEQNITQLNDNGEITNGQEEVNPMSVNFPAMIREQKVILEMIRNDFDKNQDE